MPNSVIVKACPEHGMFVSAAVLMGLLPAPNVKNVGGSVFLFRSA